jgi:hypothetical protein
MRLGLHLIDNANHRRRFYDPLLLARRTLVIAVVTFLPRTTALLAVNWLLVVNLCLHLVFQVANDSADAVGALRLLIMTKIPLQPYRSRSEEVNQIGSHLRLPIEASKAAKALLG